MQRVEPVAAVAQRHRRTLRLRVKSAGTHADQHDIGAGH